MIRKKSFKRETTHNGTLRTPVTFRRMEVSDDFYEANQVASEEFKSWAEVYDVSYQDLENLKGRFSKNALALESIKSKATKTFLTLRIRDPLSDFQPLNKDTVIVHDERYEDKPWEVVDIRPDFYNRDYLIVYLSGGSA